MSIHTHAFCDFITVTIAREDVEKGTRSECCKFLIQIDSNYDKNVVRAELAPRGTFINQALSFEPEL